MTAKVYDWQEERLTKTANEHTRAAQRYAAELLERIGMPGDYEEAVTIVAIAWLEGNLRQLSCARNLLRGDGAL